MAQEDSTTGKVIQFPQGRRARTVAHPPLPQRQFPTTDNRGSSFYDQFLHHIGEVVEKIVRREIDEIRQELERHIQEHHQAPTLIGRDDPTGPATLFDELLRRLERVAENVALRETDDIRQELEQYVRKHHSRN